MQHHLPLNIIQEQAKIQLSMQWLSLWAFTSYDGGRNTAITCCSEAQGKAIVLSNMECIGHFLEESKLLPRGVSMLMVTISKLSVWHDGREHTFV